MSSIAALRAPSAATAYAVSKAGLVMLVQSIARDFGGQGVRANVVCPGWVRTEMADAEMAEFGAPHGLDEDAAYAEVTRLVPQQRPAEAAEIASAVTWLAGPDASYVNGACLVVDGGTDPGRPRHGRARLLPHTACAPAHARALVITHRNHYAHSRLSASPYLLDCDCT